MASCSYIIRVSLSEPHTYNEYAFAVCMCICNSYNIGCLAYLLHEGAKLPRAINELSALASML